MSFPPAVAAELAGISIDSLRDWRRRFTIYFETNRGRREEYSAKDVLALAFIARASSAGLSLIAAIGEAAANDHLLETALANPGWRARYYCSLSKTHPGEPITRMLGAYASEPQFDDHLDDGFWFVIDVRQLADRILAAEREHA
jgi:DNA-binding transcriptional MerR regulator